MKNIKRDLDKIKSPIQDDCDKILKEYKAIKSNIEDIIKKSATIPLYARTDTNGLLLLHDLVLECNKFLPLMALIDETSRYMSQCGLYMKIASDAIDGK